MDIEMSTRMKANSPFTPGSPVPADLFVGRAEQVSSMLKFLQQTATGRADSIFLSGERGIGKSSMACYLRNLACRESLLAVHVFLGEATTPEEMVRRILEQILKESNTQSWYKKISDFFGKNVHQLDLFGIAVSFRPPEEDLEAILRNFPETLKAIIERIKEDKDGLFIVLDDIDSMSKKEEFANWYKSFVDHVATHYSEFPICFMLIGLPSIRDNLSRNQPSLMRVFRVLDIGKLRDKEVLSFFNRAFEKADIEIKPEALDYVLHYTGGLPIFMQEIGDAIFWADQDGIVDVDDAIQGIIAAADTIGKKYLEPKVYRAIRSPRYLTILEKMAETAVTKPTFKKKDVGRLLSPDEAKVFGNCLRKMKDLGVLSLDADGYSFVNDLYSLYILMGRAKIRPPPSL